MPPQRNRSPARLLAPIALVVAFVAVYLVVAGSGGGGSGGGPSGSAPRTAVTATATATAPRRPVRRTYSVRTGDTLGSIAERTGVTVERLQELNPALDPQALVTGQQIKLR